VIRITNAGNYAVEWTLFYYTKDVRHLLRTRRAVMRAMFEASKEMHISLATPLLHSDAETA
jgi:small-conductance mechanosensitive channel